MLLSKLNQAWHILNIQLAADAFEVGVNGVEPDGHRVGYFGVTFALGYEP